MRQTTKSKSKAQPRQRHSLTKWLKAYPRRHPLWTAFFIGFAYFTVVISWMFSIKTAEIAQGIAIKFVAASAGLIMISSFAIGFVLFVWLYRLLGLALEQRRALWMVPALWIVAEYARAVIFSIVSLGPGGRIGPYYTFGNLGYYVAETPLAFIARFGGMYLLSGLAVLIFVAAYQSWQRRDFRLIAGVIAGSVVLSLIGFVAYRNASGPVRTVGAVRYPFKNGPTQYSRESYQILAQAGDKSLDVLVLPEYSHYFEYDDDKENDKAAVSRIMKSENGLVIHSARENVAGLGHNMLTFQAANGTILSQQQKWFVVPAGEYVPYIYQVILAYAGQERLLLDFSNQKSVNPGDKIEVPYEYDGVKYGAHACSGVISPEFYNQLAGAGANMLSNSAALDTMGISALFHAEAENMNRLAAIAHARPFVQAAKGAPTYMIDHNGDRLAWNYAPEGGIVAANIQMNSTKTIYTILGDWIVYLAAIALAVYALALRMKRK